MVGLDLLHCRHTSSNKAMGTISLAYLILDFTLSIENTRKNMSLNNEQLTAIKPLLSIIGAVVVFLLAMRYVYVKQRNSWIGNLAAVLVIFWSDVKDFIREKFPFNLQSPYICCRGFKGKLTLT